MQVRTSMQFSIVSKRTSYLHIIYEVVLVHVHTLQVVTYVYGGVVRWDTQKWPVNDSEMEAK